jgi:hypothetical protein
MAALEKVVRGFLINDELPLQLEVLESVEATFQFIFIWRGHFLVFSC